MKMLEDFTCFYAGRPRRKSAPVHAEGVPFTHSSRLRAGLVDEPGRIPTFSGEDTARSAGRGP